MDTLHTLSQSLAAQVAAATPRVAAIGISGRRHQHRALSGILWRADAVVTSDQALADQREFSVAGSGGTAPAVLAGRDPTTNVAVLRLATPLSPPPAAEPPANLATGGLVLALGAAPEPGAGPVASLALLAHVGPAWHSMAGGRIDRRVLLDRLASRGLEGGPVIDAAGALVGMATAGPRRRLLVIPTETIARVFETLFAGRAVRGGWIGVGLQPVSIPESFRAAAGREAGLMIVHVEPDSPAAGAGLVPGDILLAIDGADLLRPVSLRAALGPETVGRAVTIALLRGGTPHTVTVTVAPKPNR